MMTVNIADISKVREFAEDSRLVGTRCTCKNKPSYALRTTKGMDKRE